ncbi:right-handed parallel beta-helix repeat-containing protein [Noviherbaspirillum soli]|uniref:right-handed parallel beta-helix repeat-containing protein n=1 Tax=Noviherbaspirillum soli TaxID=1064518 RepID=UPI00188C0F9B|nr:right-handed parallel beta-helix repeat-containing protein [Noviherbaspirillum soli]
MTIDTSKPHQTSAYAIARGDSSTQAPHRSPHATPAAMHRAARGLAAVPILLALHATSTAAEPSLPPDSSFKGDLIGDGRGGVVVKPYTPADEVRDGGRLEPRSLSTAEEAASAALRKSFPPGPMTLEVGPGRKIRTIAEAARLARDGDTILIDPGVYGRDVAIFTQDRLTIRAVGGRARLDAGGASAEDKAIWVVRGGHIQVENIEFIGARSSAQNGAGIRFEAGKLVLRNCLFRDNENGILTSSNRKAELEIENSEFDHNGTVEGYAHQLYAGDIARLRVSGSYFHRTVGGHLLKSRAAYNTIIYNRLTDEAGGEASYELEFPNGGLAYVVGNLIQQSATSPNPAIVAVGLEGYRWPKNALYLANNTIVDDRAADGVFLRAAPGLQAIKAVNNLLVGEGRRDASIFAGKQNPQRQPADGTKIESGGNFSVGRDAFAAPERLDYRMRPDYPLPGAYQPPGTANGIDLTPRAEYAHPAGTRRLNGAPSLPGAFQATGR